MNKKQLVRQLSVCALVLAGLTFNGSAARAKNANTDNGTSTQTAHNLANLMTAGNALNVVNNSNTNGTQQLNSQRATAQNPNGAVNQNYKSGAYWTLYSDGSLFVTGTSIAGNDDFNKILYLGLNRDSVTTYISILSPKTADVNIDYLFQGFKNVTSINHLDQINVSNTTSMQHTFSDDPALQSIDLSNWDTSNVTTTKDLFTGDSSLSKLVLGPKVYLTADAGLEKPKGADQWQAVGDGTDEDPKGKTFSPAELVSLYEKNNPNHPTATETYVPKPNKSSLVLTGDQTIANGADFDPTSFVKSITNADGDSIQPSDAVKDGSLKITGMPADTNTAKTYTLTFTYDGKSYTVTLTIEPSKAAVQAQNKTYYTGDTYSLWPSSSIDPFSLINFDPFYLCFAH
ncbi:BspA family leucine-rich repeat surface protein [Lentilactobacillus sp. G22-6]|uniref:BspA family leucine-rich repeat surface protein n=1 Tax=Lentilactobacillus dabitei TaxID=2831523 RepID=UPI001C27874B|nr:BspA family leucine-rich repeat surface protein [Lentilactobacillus dabitei]MBU9789483.1 BspA family leucine-rich repeat surface protein [Lentilactobacillus dabitei]